MHVCVESTQSSCFTLKKSIAHANHASNMLTFDLLKWLNLLPNVLMCSLYER